MTTSFNVDSGPPPERLRELGRIESVMAFSHAMLCGTGQIVLVMELACEAEVDLALLQRACACVYQRFALLRCVIEEAHAGLYFSWAADLADIAVWHEAVGDFTAFARQAVDAPELDARRALWRVAVAQTNTPDRYHLALTLHHAIVDASGAGLITSALLASLDALLGGEAPQESRSDVVPPALDDFLMAAQTTDAASTAVQPAPAKRPAAWAPITERRTGFQTFELAAPIHAEFLRNCRTHGVTDNALLTALYVQACAAQGIADAPVAVRSAVSVRDALGTAAEAEALGCYIGVNSTIFDTGTALESARRYQRDHVRSVLASCLRKRAFTAPALREAMVAAERTEAFQGGIGITNVGRVNPAAGLKRILLHRYMPLARRVSNANACVLHVHSFDEHLALTLVYPEPNFSSTCAAAILADLGQAVAAFAQDDAAPAEAAA